MATGGDTADQGRMAFADPPEDEERALDLVFVEDVEEPFGVGADATLHAVPVDAWDDAVGSLNNDSDGRATLVGLASAVISDMTNQGALTPGGKIYEDPSNPPAGSSAYFVVEVDDLDSLEHLYLRFGFRFAPPAA